MLIHNMRELAFHFDTSPYYLRQVISNRAKRDVEISECLSNLRIESFIGECNTTLEIVCHYPFDSAAVDTFINQVEQFFLDCTEHLCSECTDVEEEVP